MTYRMAREWLRMGIQNPRASVQAEAIVNVMMANLQSLAAGL